MLFAALPIYGSFFGFQYLRYAVGKASAVVSYVPYILYGAAAAAAAAHRV